LEILETNGTEISPPPSFFVAQRLSTAWKTWGNFGRLEVGGESGVLEHKSGNISETRKDKGKVTMESLQELPYALSDGTIPDPTPQNYSVAP